MKKVLDGRTSLGEALAIVNQTKDRIQEVESMLPGSSNRNFRERLVQQLEHGHPDVLFKSKAHDLLSLYKEQFGVKDLIDHLSEETDFD